jgi:iron complex outermembrane receptor protein
LGYIVKKQLLLCSTAMVMFPTAAFAQSTGSVEFEKTIVVTGTRVQEVGGIQTPDAPKAKAVLTQEIIARSGPGQTVLDTINVVPGVSFQNNDGYGNSGGTLTMRGFDATRISYTLDGIQLNDSGNYSIYSNFSIDPELIEQVNVNLGSTDVDSPTASAVGGTINQRTLTPTRNMGGRVNLSGGEFGYRRAFGLLNSGEFGPWGTRAFVAASTSQYENPFNFYGEAKRLQLNAKVYQPVGNGGDFFSIAGRYNRDRNNFFGSLPLRWDTTQSITDLRPRTVGPNSTQRFPTNNDERDYNINVPCTLDTPQAGVTDAPTPATLDRASCGTEFDRRMNPSNSFNIRGNSRFSLTDKLTFTFDPSFQYTKANGGGTVNGNEGLRDINPLQAPDPDGAGPLPRPPAIATVVTCATAPTTAFNNCQQGYFGGQPYFGRDLNGDGDTRDAVTLLAPSQTRTRRIIAIAGLRYEFNNDHSVRLSYTYDRSNHRQTGEVGLVENDGEPDSVFPVNDPLLSASGLTLQKRDRQSYAILNKIAAEYRGTFGNLTATIGASLPFFKRDLQNNCFTSSAGGFVECSGNNAALDAVLAANNPYTFNPATGQVTGWAPPGHRVLKYKKFQPNLGLIYDFSPSLSAFASYAKNISVPSTDNLYNAFYFPADTAQAKPRPEVTETFDGGLRYRSRQIQAQLSGWHTKFVDRLASAYDPDLNQTVYRNLGKVTKYGIDGSVAYEPMKELTLYAFGSWMRSKIKDNILLNETLGITDCDAVTDRTTNAAIRSCAFTAGKFEAGSPKYTLGASAVARFSQLELGITAKRTGPRYVYDNNAASFTGVPGGTPATVREIFPNKAPAYTLVNLDARLKLDQVNLAGSYVQLNVYNLFDKFYVGGFGGGLNQSFSGANYGNPSFVQVGAPRTVSATLSLAF